MSDKKVSCYKKQQGSLIFSSHGCGPWPILGDPRHVNLIDFLKNIPSTLISPSAILVISGHWEEDSPTVQGSAQPPMLYDYYNFPEESYQISYPAPGYPELAHRISSILKQNSIESKVDMQRGYDHGVFVPLMIMYPEATIPCLQLSLLNSLDPKDHIQIGRALKDLRNENILIIGSGASFHNLLGFREVPTPETIALNEGFEAWLQNVMTNSQLSETEREEQLINWLDAPGARYCHPREEHLLPMHVCYGLAGCPANRVIEVEYMERKASMYIWSTD